MDRRTFLIALGMTMAGCGGSQAGSSPTEAPSPTESAGSTATATPGDYPGLFREELAARDIDVKRLASNGVRADLGYAIETTDRPAVEESLLYVAQAFEQPVAKGWGVEGLDATVLESGSGDRVGAFAIESIWAKQYHEGTIDLGAYRRKVLDTLRFSAPVPGTPSPTSTPERTPQETPSVQGFELGAVDSVKDNAFATIDVHYNFEPTRVVDLKPDDGVEHDTSAGFRYLAVQVRVENRSSVNFSFSPAAIKLRKDGGDIERFRQFRDTHNPLNGADIEPDGEIVGGIPYLIDKDLEGGELLYNQSYYTADVTCRFHYDGNLDVAISG